MEDVFQCKKFVVKQTRNTMKVNVDGMLLGSWVAVDDITNALDIGTGTGIIAMIIAQRTSNNVQVDGVEIHNEAAAEARENFKNAIWADRLDCIHRSVQDYSLEFDGKYDLIISNPPFFTGGTFSENENKNNVKHSVKLSHGDLLIAGNRLLSSTGRMAVILPFIEGERYIERAERMGFQAVRITEVRSRRNKPIERLLIELTKATKPPGKCSRDTLIMLEDTKERTYTKDFKLLTEDFYTIF